MEPEGAAPSTAELTQEEGLIRAIGVRALAANVVNLTVGAGIFVLPALVASTLGPSAVAAYVLCGLLMGLVLLCYAEVGSRVTRSGGSYAYVEAAFGPYAGFLVGTLLWLVFGVLGNAAVANIFVGTLARASPVFEQPGVRALTLVVLYLGLVLLNMRGVRQGARFAVVATVVKLVPLLLLVAVGLPAIEPANLSGLRLPAPGPLGDAALLLFFAFAGPEGALNVSGEIRRPARTIPRGLLIGAAGVVALYVALHVVAQGVLGPALSAEAEAPLAAAAGQVMGPAGTVLLLTGAALSMFGALSGDILAGPRILFATAKDGSLPHALARVHPRFHTPHVAIAAYAVLACTFAVTGAFNVLASVATAGLLLVYLGVCLATLVLRRRETAVAPDAFRLPGGPLIPLLAVAAIGWVLSHVSGAEAQSLAGFLLVASVLYAVRRKTMQV